MNQILFIDNYDSFTYNLVQQVKVVGSTQDLEVRVFRNNEININDINFLNPNAIILSPGPGKPDNTGICLELVKEFQTTPILGICLGHQVIGKAYGATITHADLQLHGKTSILNHYKTDLFDNVENDIKVARYHSLIVSKNNLPDCLEITAEANNEIMAIKHKASPHWGIQFHPESFLTESGNNIIDNFLNKLN